MGRLWGRLWLNRFWVSGWVGMGIYADPAGTWIQDATGFITAMGGSAGNIAAALSRQGAHVSMLSVVSDDAAGRCFLAQLQGYGVDCGHAQAVAGEARN